MAWPVRFVSDLRLYCIPFFFVSLDPDSTSDNDNRVPTSELTSSIIPRDVGCWLSPVISIGISFYFQRLECFRMRA